MRAHTFVPVSIAALAAVSLVAFGPCVEKRPLENGLGGFRVTVTGVNGASGEGTLESPYAYPQGAVSFSISAQAIDRRGAPLAWEGEATVSVQPGEVVSIDPPSPSGFVARFSQGTWSGTVTARKTYGRVAVWLEDARWMDTDPALNFCREDRDCDPRGTSGAVCEEGVCSPSVAVPQKTIAGSQATGVSRHIYFRNPALQHIQIDGPTYGNGAATNDLSAMTQSFVEIDTRADATGPLPPGHGQLIVTGIFNEGFFVTDLAPETLSFLPAELQRGFNHLYAYSFSYPDELLVGDRLDVLAGTTQDFSGATQISFPFWRHAQEKYQPEQPCIRHQDCTAGPAWFCGDGLCRIGVAPENLDAVVPPTPITAELCNEDPAGQYPHLCGYSKKSWKLEMLESARVSLTDLRFPDLFLNCDFNGDGDIAPSYPVPEDPNLRLEYICRDECLARTGTLEVSVREAIAPAEVLARLAVAPCAAPADCASGVCGEDHACREICPFEATIPNVAPHCLRLKVDPDTVCSELSTLRQYGQWTVAMQRGLGPLINISTGDSAPTFDPTAASNLGRLVDSAAGEKLQGNLRQVRAARPRWIVLVGWLPNDMPDWMRP